MVEAEGALVKMRVCAGTPIAYTLNLSDTDICVNNFLGCFVSLRYTGKLICINCAVPVKKVFGQGLCYACFQTAPINSECIIRPELCQGHLGFGRSVAWEQQYHVQPHVVYLALNEGGVKVGVAQLSQIPTRWIDQGASAAIVLAQVPYRQLAGLIEVYLKQYFSDKTNWQRMLKGGGEASIFGDDNLLQDAKARAVALLSADWQKYVSESNVVTEFSYPVLRYNGVIKGCSFDKVSEVSGVLVGIKGQYLMFESGCVFNVRNHSGYVVRLTAD